MIITKAVFYLDTIYSTLYQGRNSSVLNTGRNNVDKNHLLVTSA